MADFQEKNKKQNQFLEMLNKKHNMKLTEDIFTNFNTLDIDDVFIEFIKQTDMKESLSIAMGFLRLEQLHLILNQKDNLQIK